MDFAVPSLVGTSDGSSCNDSTGLLTPDSSPLFRPSHLKDSFETRLAHALEEPKRRRLDPPSARAESPFIPSFADLFAPVPSDVRKICVIGAGYVGGPTAAVIALHNPKVGVEVLDRDQRRIERWNSAHLPIHEPGLNKIVRLTRDGAIIKEPGDRNSISHGRNGESDYVSRRGPNLFFTCDTQVSISTADMVFLAVNTPTKTTGVGAGRATNMTALDGAVKDVALYAKPGTIIVEKSTVPCGTAQRIRNTLDALRPGVPFEVLSNPEFLSEGTAIKNLMKPDRVIIGSSGTPSGKLAADALASLYAAWIPSSQILQINAWSSELSKLVANAMLAQRISSINSISAICEATGANVEEIAKSIGLDTRIGPQFLKAGLGFGGSCFRKDIASLTYLAESLGLEEVAHYWGQVNSINVMQRNRFARKVLKRFNENLFGKKITLMGFAFKKNTSDARESPAVDVIRTLLDEQPAEIAIFDPFCDEDDMLREINAAVSNTPGFAGETSSVKIYTDPYEACMESNAILIITDCDQFKNSPQRLRGSNASETSLPTNKPASTCASPKQQEDDHLGANFANYRLAPQPDCVANCPDCRSKARGPISTDPVEWARIVYSMREPKWIFDGRGIIDADEMEKLGGVRVDGIGKWRPEDGQKRCW
ncbi:UDPglucose 6-dehydrogenase [Cladophialophora psammophila CBS 110553]|uniref:UDP-glucose 6-dehydrogenase n=1 Tax=Cladophialophora psammophila CBS 110553 TaxID=1182543 RepID=W9WZ07_9EURO|nr:UDPglucose 6-dehydrogenase [Cladophialophora psammophila CBS 110553]EXJ69886.1 UDPglucose 6-dehydrogenase [Cladophialophora psammophila CBS 110553]